MNVLHYVSTHSRPKAAGPSEPAYPPKSQRVSTHSRPKAAGLYLHPNHVVSQVSTHSRPKAAGGKLRAIGIKTDCFNTQPPEGGWIHINPRFRFHLGFNTQPPEGGWNKIFLIFFDMFCFNTQPPEGGWAMHND